MSVTPPIDGGTPHEPDPQVFAALMETLQRIAEGVSRRAGIPQEKEDLVQHAFAELHANGLLNGRLPEESVIAKIVKKRASRVVRRRKKERSNQDLSAGALHNIATDGSDVAPPRPEGRPAAGNGRRVGIPRLGVPLLRLAKGTRDEQRMEALVLAASTAIARRPKALDRRHREAVSLAYLLTLPIDEIATSLDTSRRGVTETLKRALRNVNAVLMSEVVGRVDAGTAAAILARASEPTPKKKRRSKKPLGKSIRAAILHALDGVIHSDSSQSRP